MIESPGSVVHGHTASWDDGLVVTRLFISRGQMYLRITWNGVQRELRLGSRVGEFVSLGERVRSGLAQSEKSESSE